jgi:hypothetical protein
LVYTVLASNSLLPDSWSPKRNTFGSREVTGDTHDFITVNVETKEDQLFIRLQIDYQSEAP